MKLLISLAFFIITTQINLAQIVNFNFNTSPYLTVSSKDANISVSETSLSSGTIETNISTGTYFNDEPYIEESGGWTETVQSSAKHFTFTITAKPGYEFSITNILFDAYATSAGPTAFSAEIDGTSITSIDAPSANLVNYNQPVSKIGLTTAVIKIQGWLNGSRSSTGGGTFRLDNVIISGTVSTIPLVTINKNSLNDFFYSFNIGPSAEQIFTINGTDLTSDINIIPPTNYEISTSAGDTFAATNPIILSQNSGIINSTSIYVRLKSGLNIGQYSNELISATSNGAANKIVTCTGVVVPNLIINEILADPDPTNGDANGDGSIDIHNDEFVEIINTTRSPIDISNYSLSDDTDINHIFANSTIIHAGESITIFGGGAPTSIPGLAVTASSGSLLLNNAADAIILMDASNNVIDSYSYGTEGGDNQSLGRNPDVIGSFFKHTTISTNPVYQSPGKNNSDNTPLPVELTSFSASAQNNSIILSWETATEINNYGFEVERQILTKQTDNSNWSKVGFVEGNGNGSSPKQYSYADNNINSGSYSYRLKQIDFDGMFEFSKVISVQINSPVKYELSQNFPNPFNPSTVIEYSIPNNDYVSLKVYDILGNEVANLVYENKEAGTYKVNFDASNLPGANSSLTSGIYFYSIKTSSFNQVRKMMLVK